MCSLLKCSGISPFLQGRLSTFVVTGLVSAGLVASDKQFSLGFTVSPCILIH